MWMHPNHEAQFANLSDPDRALTRRMEVARHSGVPDGALTEYVKRAKDMPSGVAETIEPDRPLVDGVTIDSDLGTWQVIETPGHTPSHVCLFQPERRVLISGDHLLGRISLFYDYGWTPDPAGEFLNSLDVVDELDARLCLSGHGKPFVDVHGHVEANRRLVRERVEAVLGALTPGPKTVVEAVPLVYGEPLTEANGNWRLTETLTYLRHLENQGRVAPEPDGEIERWRLVQP